MLIGNAIQSNAILNRSNAAAASRHALTTPSGSPSFIAGQPKETPKTTESRSTTQELLEKLNEYIEKGPVAAMREKILKSMGLTEDELKALPPEKQEAIEAEIAEKIKEMLLRQQEAAKNQFAPSPKTDLYTALNGM